MDTLILHEKFYPRLIENTINVSIIGLLVFSQCVVMPIMADDLKLAHMNAPSLDTGQIKEKILNEISPERRLENFNSKIKQKYPKAAIYNVEDGVKHIKMTKYYDGKPVRINVVEIDRKIAKDFTLTPALASETLANRRTITKIAENSHSIVALNGTYFKPQTGVPLGTLMINGKIMTGPIYDRVALGIFDEGYDTARIQLNASIKADKTVVKIDNINQPRMLSTYVLAYTSQWGKTSPATPKYGIQVAIEDGKISKVSNYPMEIPENGYVIVGPAKELQPLVGAKKIDINITTRPEWKDIRHIISGGPYLVKDGEVFVDMTAQRLGAIGGKNPRSAIGYTADNDLILVAVDGREGASVGMTLMQLAGFMKSIGCVGAINLDGGGSTVMYVKGQIVNNPAVKGGIPLSNAIVLSKTDKT